MLKEFGNPQDSFKTIHVAGTNGKGSVCAYLDAMFREGGFKCGLFTSPHLIKVNERFKINGQDISDEDYERLYRKVKAVADAMVARGLEEPTYFEIICVIGMLYFKEQEVDIAIIETGLGGRLDPTNAISKPLACVITSIGLDHMEYLGDTLPKIATEKAGIIKPYVPVIYEKTNMQVAQIIEEKAKEVEAPTYQLDNSMYKIILKNVTSIDFSLHYQYYRDSVISVNGLASYQVSNASLALLVMAVLRDFHQMSVEVSLRGIAKAKWPGRMEEVLPRIFLDGAHNEEGILAFAKTATEFSDKYKITILFTAVADKKYTKMIHLICDKVKPSAVVTTQIKGERSVDATRLAEVFNDAGCQNVHSNPDVTMAFAQARELKGDGLLFCIGSLYMIGEIQLYLDRRNINDRL